MSSRRPPEAYRLSYRSGLHCFWLCLPRRYLPGLVLKPETQLSNARSANPFATVVSSSPPRRRPAPNRCSNRCLTAGTNDDPPVRKTLSTSLGITPQQSSSRSTHCVIADRYGSIHSSKTFRRTCSEIATGGSENKNELASCSESVHLVRSTVRKS